LQALACDHVQGFLLARPLNTMDFEDLLRKHWKCIPGRLPDESVSPRT
jgi:EAL domain-containing protein (putative c-di-GMP-specific phosphodiesterase class I)